MKVDNPNDYKRLLNITQKNIFDLKNNKFIIGQYKTEKTHGIRFITIPKKLIQIVEKWYQITDSKNLIPNLKEKDVPMTQQAFTDLLFRIFQPKNISTSMLRKIYISDKLKNSSFRNDPVKRKKLAHEMGHTLETQEFIYNRFK
jgi:integrase